MWRSSDSSAQGQDTTGAGTRRSATETGTTSAKAFFKKMLPGQWKRGTATDQEGNAIQRLSELPQHIRDEVRQGLA